MKADQRNELISDLAENMTEFVINNYTNAPVWEHDGGNDPNSFNFTDEAQDAYDAIQERIETIFNDTFNTLRNEATQ